MRIGRIGRVVGALGIAMAISASEPPSAPIASASGLAPAPEVSLEINEIEFPVGVENMMGYVSACERLAESSSVLSGEKIRCVWI